MASEQALLGGRYEIRELLGRGGMATVHRGRDTRLGRSVAVKRLVPILAADPICQARFQREARSSASLSHPAIVAVFDTGAQSDPDTEVSIPYLVMELVDGKTLREVLRSSGKVTAERALELTRDVLEALGHSHEAGIVHRDIKPANVMVTATGGVKVMDFGIARAVAETSTDFTQTASVVGTAHYLSPEQARGEKVGFSSDIYSAGCLLFELLTCRPPFVGESVLSVIYQHVREAPVPPSELEPAIGPAMDAVVLKALAKDPADRYATAREMKADIDRLLAGDQPLAHVASSPSASSPVASSPAASTPAAESSPEGQRRLQEWPVEDAIARVGGPWSRSNRRGLALGFALVVMLMALGGYGLYRSFVPEAAAGQLVQIPDLVGRTQAEAEQALQGVQLSARLQHVHGSSGATLHTVVRQSPQGGRDAQPGTTVTIGVNDGPTTARVPTGLVGRDVSAVRRELEAAGFHRVSVEQSRSQPKDAAPGEVVAVAPSEGTPVVLTYEVVLSVARAVAADTRATQQSTTNGSAPQRTTSTKAQRQASLLPRSSPPSGQTPTSPSSPSSSRPSQPSQTLAPTSGQPASPGTPRPTSSPSKTPTSSPSTSPASTATPPQSPSGSSKPAKSRSVNAKPPKAKPAKPSKPGGHSDQGKAHQKKPGKG